MCWADVFRGYDLDGTRLLTRDNFRRIFDVHSHMC